MYFILIQKHQCMLSKESGRQGTLIESRVIPLVTQEAQDDIEDVIW